MSSKQLTFAREFRGFSQTELANSISGLSQSNLSKYEKGFDVLSDDVLKRIYSFLNFPDTFCKRKIATEITNANYRKKSTINKADVTRFELKCKLLGYVIDEFSESIDWLDFNLPVIDCEKGYTPEYIANYTRKSLGLKSDEPVKNICELLESNGIIIYEIDEIEKFDGISFITEKGVAVIVVNKSFSNDRKRFTIAHELGHLLLHNENNFPVSSTRDKENEANYFASEFLMPAEAIKNSLRGLKMSDLVALKSYWLTSMSSIIRRAKDLKTINEDRYRFFMIEMSRYGYNRKEPIDVFIDKPTCFKNAVKLFEEELEYDLEHFAISTSLPIDVIDEIICNKLVRLKSV